jgi:hypothetical protein
MTEIEADCPHHYGGLSAPIMQKWRKPDNALSGCVPKVLQYLSFKFE